jgi:inner membrane protein
VDNLTHTLIGLIAGEAVAQTAPPRDGGLPANVRRSLFVALAVIGGNLPDIDLLYSYRGLSQHKLNYLLQHRGYTHSVIGCLLLAALLVAATEWWMHVRRWSPTPIERWSLAGMAVFGTGLHLAMDALNAYGVHPFWPLQDRWFYGDSVFIIEPLYWVAAAPLFFAVRSTWVRAVIALALIAGLLLSVISHLVRPAGCLAYGVATGTLLAAGRRASARTAALASAALAVGITAIFILAGQHVAGRVESLARTNFPGDLIIDHVLMPMPMNPLCWDVLLLATNADRYTIRHGAISSAPRLTAAATCPSIPVDRHTTAPLTAVAASDSDEMHWSGEFSMSKSQLLRLVAAHCDAAAFMQFARAPFATRFGDAWMIGDFRFDREPELGIAEIALPLSVDAHCRSAVPWSPPRGDLLR